MESNSESLEWGELLAHYSAHCLSVPAREAALRTAPAEDVADAAERIEKTAEALSIVESKSFASLGTLDDLSSVLERLEKASVLDGKELLAVARLAGIATELKDGLSGGQEAWPLLDKDIASLPELKNLPKPVLAAIDEEGTVRDTASPLLRGMRDQERKLHSEAREKLDGILLRAFRDGFLQDKFFDFRDGRYLIPVRAEAKSKVPGFVMESSATRSTVFMEPAALRESNDKIKQTRMLIEEEIYRILDELSRKLYPHAAELKLAYAVAVEIDLCLGRAYFAREYGSLKGVSKPEFSDRFLLEDLYHPLLAFVIDPKKVVRNNFSLGPDKKVLVISGPNTGGKTVLLKAVGLFALMARCGFYLPCDGKAELPFFRNVLAQIGDSQNLELSLSSFSGSLLHLKGIVEAGGEQSLVLVDEILHATDPDEATALSRAIMEELQARGAYCVVTTHLNGLKVAGATGFESASMEFNPAEMQPTYRLRMGIPGSSRALEIAQRLGLSSALVDKARSYLSAERIEEQKAVDRLEIRERELDEAKLETVAAKRELEEERGLHRLLNDELAAVKKRFRGEAMEKIRRQQQEAMATLDGVIALYKSKLSSVDEKHKAALEAQAELETVRVQFKNVEQSLDEVAPAPVVAPMKASIAAPRFVKNGPVFVKSMQADGVLLSDPSASGKLEVAVGTMRIRVALDQLEPKAIPESAKPVVKQRYHEASECPPELMLIGLTVDEASDRVEAYLDLAARSGRPSVRIVHGHGSGALKNAIRKLLAKSGYEMKFRPGSASEGGEGCTVVEFT